MPIVFTDMQSVNQDIMNYTYAMCYDFTDIQSVDPTFWITDMQCVNKDFMQSVMNLRIWNL